MNEDDSLGNTGGRPGAVRSRNGLDASPGSAVIGLEKTGGGKHFPVSRLRQGAGLFCGSSAAATDFNAKIAKIAAKNAK